MDTIEVSNLNRQFLFKMQDAGRPKAVVPANRVTERVNGVNIVPRFCRIEDKDCEFYRVFDQHAWDMLTMERLCRACKYAVRTCGRSMAWMSLCGGIFELSSSLCLVDVRKTGGDTPRFRDEDLKPVNVNLRDEALIVQEISASVLFSVKIHIIHRSVGHVSMLRYFLII